MAEKPAALGPPPPSGTPPPGTVLKPQSIVLSTRPSDQLLFRAAAFGDLDGLLLLDGTDHTKYNQNAKI